MVVQGRSSHTTQVSSIMTPKTQLRVLTPENSIMEAMEQMADLHIRHVPVVSVLLGTRGQQGTDKERGHEA